MIQRLQWLYPPTAFRFFLNLLTILCDRLETTDHTLAQVSLLDDLTQMYNRRGFVKILKAEACRSKRYRQGVTMLLIGIRFRKDSESQVFENRDRLIKEFCAFLQNHVRECDITGRIDLQTFAVLMPNTSFSRGEDVYRRMGESLLQTHFESGGLAMKVHLEVIDLSSETQETVSGRLSDAVQEMYLHLGDSPF